jgi:hypothetical protein
MKVMSQSAKKQWGLALLGLAGIYFAFTYVMPAVGASTGDTSKAGKCISSQHQLVAQGRGPSGSPWTITGSIRKNDGCDSWLLGMEFRPTGGVPGSTSWGWGIPVGGHLSQAFTIDAQDEVASSGRAFYGTVGGNVRTVKVQMSGGQPLILHPKLPAQHLRKQFVWLQNMRYLMRFHPAGSHPEVVTLLGSDGQVIEKVTGLEGEFSGPGV